MNRLLLVTALTLPCAACMVERNYVDPVTNTQINSQYNGPSSAGFSAGRLRGDLGPIRNFDDNQARVDGYIDDGFASTSVTVYGDAPDGTGFMMLDFSDIDLRNSPAGTTQLDDNTYAVICSDDHDGSIHFDGPVESGDVTITDVDSETREVTVNTTIRGDGFSDFNEQTNQTAVFRIQR